MSRYIDAELVEKHLIDITENNMNAELAVGWFIELCKGFPTDREKRTMLNNKKIYAYILMIKKALEEKQENCAIDFVNTLAQKILDDIQRQSAKKSFCRSDTLTKSQKPAKIK